MKVKRIVYGIVLVLGVSLLLLNIAGLAIPLRSADLDSAPQAFENDITLTADEFFAILEQEYSSNQEFVTRATQAVSQAVLHYWELEGIEKYNLRIPIYENYFLFLSARLNPVRDARYEYCDYRKAIERGVGYCSQVSLILHGILEEQGIQAKILAFPWLHVIATAQVDVPNDVWWTLDPDYGVTIPHRFDEIVANPDLIQPYYAAEGYNQEEINKLKDIFTTQVYVSDSPGEYFGGIKCKIEAASYWIIWILPLYFIAVGILPFARRIGLKN